MQGSISGFVFNVSPLEEDATRCVQWDSTMLCAGVRMSVGMSARPALNVKLQVIQERTRLS
jgi:hypothetical protein